MPKAMLTAMPDAMPDAMLTAMPTATLSSMPAGAGDAPRDERSPGVP